MLKCPAPAVAGKQGKDGGEGMLAAEQDQVDLKFEHTFFLREHHTQLWNRLDQIELVECVPLA